MGVPRLPELPPERPPALSPGLTRLSDVPPERIAWLWPSRIPLGKLTILDGTANVGKSTLLLDIAARVTTGRPMPLDTGPALEVGNVLLMTAEDSLGDTVRQRFRAAEGDASRLIVWQGRLEKDEKGTDILNAYLSLGEHTRELEAVINETGASLVIVDVLMAYLGQANSYKDQEVRALLAPIQQIAERTGCAIVAIRHPGKDKNRNAIDSGGGSGGITNAARSVLRADIHPDDPETRVLAAVKMNIATKPAALTYRLEACLDNDGYSYAARVEWLGVSDLTADDLAAGPPKKTQGEPVPPKRAETCAAYILELFDQVAPADTSGRKTLEASWAAERVKGAGYNSTQMTEAKKLTGVRSQKTDGVNLWVRDGAPVAELDLTDSEPF